MKSEKILLAHKTELNYLKNLIGSQKHHKIEKAKNFM
jgi:hypothetical protein